MEIESKSDRSRNKFRMIDTLGGHYRIVLEAQEKQDSNIIFMEDVIGTFQVNTEKWITLTQSIFKRNITYEVIGF